MADPPPSLSRCTRHVNMFTTATCVPACTLTVPFLTVNLSLCLPAFSKAYSPQRKGHTQSASTHTHPDTAKRMSGLTWPCVFHQSTPSPVFPVLLITHATTHDDTHAGCGSGSGGSLEPHDRGTTADGFLPASGSRYQERRSLEVMCLSSAALKKTFFFFRGRGELGGDQSQEALRALGMEHMPLAWRQVSID